MTAAALESRHVCAALMVLCALALAWPMRPRVARIVWSALLVVALAHAVVLSLLPQNLRNINLVHYYLGAKYPFPYASCYQVVDAALERPQVSMRDLEQPTRMLRDDPREQRAYYIDLLRADGVDFDPLQPLAGLRQRAQESGALHREAERILGAALPAGRIEAFREDARRALAPDEDLARGGEQQRDITTDYGFNGSPLYAAVRHVDPALYLPFGRATVWINVLWQIAATLGIAWCAAAALELGRDERLACVALLFSSWDAAGWGFGGLIFAGLWLPIALALLAWRRGWFAASGACIAWAGLIKLFPFVLLLPLLVRAARAPFRRDASTRASLRVLIGAACATPLLLAAGALSGRSWLEFGRKIAGQFQTGEPLSNSVGASDALRLLGIHESPLPQLFGALTLLAFAWLFVRGDEGTLRERLPRRSLVLLAATGWLVGTWLNYYAIAPLFLLPLVARTQRWLAAVLALAMAAPYALPEFGDPGLAHEPALQALKLLPYVLVPLALLALELWPMLVTRRARIVAAALASIALLATAGEGLLWRHIRLAATQGDAALERGDTGEAWGCYTNVVELTTAFHAPRYDRMAWKKLALTEARSGRDAYAQRHFASLIHGSPDDASIRLQLALLRMKSNDFEGAAADLEAARELAPCDEEILVQLARVRLAQGRTDEARAHLARARELTPRNLQIQRLLDQIH